MKKNDADIKETGRFTVIESVKHESRARKAVVKLPKGVSWTPGDPNAAHWCGTLEYGASSVWLTERGRGTIAQRWSANLIPVVEGQKSQTSSGTHSRVRAIEESALELKRLDGRADAERPLEELGVDKAGRQPNLRGLIRILRRYGWDTQGTKEGERLNDTYRGTRKRALDFVDLMMGERQTVTVGDIERYHAQRTGCTVGGEPISAEAFKAEGYELMDFYPRSNRPTGVRLAKQAELEAWREERRRGKDAACPGHYLRAWTATAELAAASAALSNLENRENPVTNRPFMHTHPMKGLYLGSKKKRKKYIPDSSRFLQMSPDEVWRRADELLQERWDRPVLPGLSRALLFLAYFTGQRPEALRLLRRADYLGTEKDVRGALRACRQQENAPEDMMLEAWSAPWTEAVDGRRGTCIHFRREGQKGRASLRWGRVVPIAPKLDDVIRWWLDELPENVEWFFPCPSGVDQCITERDATAVMQALEDAAREIIEHSGGDPDFEFPKVGTPFRIWRSVAQTARMSLGWLHESAYLGSWTTKYGNPQLDSYTGLSAGSIRACAMGVRASDYHAISPEGESVKQAYAVDLNPAGEPEMGNAA